MYTIETSFTRLESIAFSADGRLAVLSGGYWWKCAVWSLPPDPANVWTDEDPEPYAFGLAFDPRTGHILHGDAKEGLTATGPEDRSGWFEVPGGPLRAFAVSPVGDRLVCGCERWGGRSTGQEMCAQLVAFTRGGKKKHWTRSAVLEGDGFLFSDVVYFSDGKRLASIEWSSRKRRGEYHQGDVPTLRVHESKSLDEDGETTFKGPAKGLVVCGNAVVVRGEKAFRVWDADDLEADLLEVKTGRAVLGAVAADPQGRFVLTAVGESVSVWDSASWKVSKTYDWASGKITCLAVQPGGLMLAAGTATGKVVVWDTE